MKLESGMKGYEFNVTAWTGFRQSVLIVAESWDKAFAIASEVGRYPYMVKAYPKVVVSDNYKPD